MPPIGWAADRPAWMKQPKPCAGSMVGSLRPIRVASESTSGTLIRVSLSLTFNPRDPLDPLDPPVRRGPGGGELVLSIVRAIARAHCGTVSATARQEGGLDVQVRL